MKSIVGLAATFVLSVLSWIGLIGGVSADTFKDMNYMDWRHSLEMEIENPPEALMKGPRGGMNVSRMKFQTSAYPGIRSGHWVISVMSMWMTSVNGVACPGVFEEATRSEDGVELIFERRSGDQCRSPVNRVRFRITLNNTVEMALLNEDTVLVSSPVESSLLGIYEFQVPAERQAHYAGLYTQDLEQENQMDAEEDSRIVRSVVSKDLAKVRISPGAAPVRKPVRKMNRHKEEKRHMAFFDEDQYLIIVYGIRDVEVWDTQSLDRLKNRDAYRIFNRYRKETGWRYFYDHKADGRFKIMDWESGQPLKLETFGDWPIFFQDNRHAVVTHTRRQSRIFDLQSGKLRSEIRLDNETVAQILLHPNGTDVLISTRRGPVLTFSLQTGELKSIFELDELSRKDSRKVVLSPNGQYVAGQIEGGNVINLWRLSDGAKIQRLLLPAEKHIKISLLGFSGNGAHLILNQYLMDPAGKRPTRSSYLAYELEKQSVTQRMTYRMHAPSGITSVGDHYFATNRLGLTEYWGLGDRMYDPQQMCPFCHLPGGDFLMAVHDGEFGKARRLADAYTDDLDRVRDEALKTVLQYFNGRQNPLSMSEELLGFYMLRGSRSALGCLDEGYEERTYTFDYPDKVGYDLDGFEDWRVEGGTVKTTYRVNPEFAKACDALCNRHGALLMEANGMNRAFERSRVLEVFDGVEEIINGFACDDPAREKFEHELLRLTGFSMGQ